MTSSTSLALAAAALFVLGGCGGSATPFAGGVPAQVPPQPNPVPVPDPTPAPTPTPNPIPEPPPTIPSAFLYWNQCAAPRPGVDSNNYPFPDRQGTLADELNFVRGWINEFYLWYDEVPNTYNPKDFANPVDYFNVLKTPAITASGKPKDKYHFTYPSARWEAMNGKGVDVGYGVNWSRNTGANLPRTWIATTVEPGSPSDAAGLRRGDMLVTVDDVDFINAGDSASVGRINAGLFPVTAGEVHRLTVRRGSATLDATLASASVQTVPVKNTKVIDTPTGKVGYLTFGSHNAVSELQLIESVAQLKAAGVTDLVLDVRYNGGGLLYIASELAYMIAGPAATVGKVFEQARYSDKIKPQPPLLFRSTAYGYRAPAPALAGQELPYLGLKRVTLLTTPGTCSASESIINSLRGVDVEVNLIGGQTCGKPYAFTPAPNCGTTYFAIEFQGVNNKGFGDYADGIAPTCVVADDLGHQIGDPAEGMLAAALSYRATSACPAQPRASAVPLQLVRPPVEEISIYTRR